MLLSHHLNDVKVKFSFIALIHNVIFKTQTSSEISDDAFNFFV
jgi:hypothetical protein